MKRMSFGKKLVKDMCMSYCFFNIKRDQMKALNKSQYEYLIDLFKDLQVDLFTEPTNSKHLEVLAEESGSNVFDNRAKIEDYYVFMGFNLFNLHFMKKHQESLKEHVNVEEGIKKYNEQYLFTGMMLKEYLEALSDDEVMRFNKKVMKTLLGLEGECIQVTKEYLEKSTGKQVSICSPRHRSF